MNFFLKINEFTSSSCVATNNEELSLSPISFVTVLFFLTYPTLVLNFALN